MNKLDTTQPQSSAELANSYENNPLYVATNGLDLLFKRALSVGILFAILSALSAFSGIPSSFTPKTEDQPTGSSSPSSNEAGPANFMDALSSVSVEMWLFIGLLVIVALVVMTLIIVVVQGISDVTSARLARGETVNATDALKEVFQNFWGYLWVIIITNVKILLWTLLLIIPGIVMAIRYSLSGVVYFDKKLKGNASVLESSRLVKGAWLTTFASQSLLNILTLGFIAPLLTPGTNAVLYRQLSAASEPKPKAHIVSWLTLIIPLVLGSLVLFFFIWAAANYMNSVQ